MKPRVADCVIDYIYTHEPDTIFTVAGGGAMFLNEHTLKKTIQAVYRYKGPVMCDIHVLYWQDIITVSSKKMTNGKMTSSPIDDMYPFLSPEEMQVIQQKLE